MCYLLYCVSLALLVPAFSICSAAAFVVAGERAKDETVALPAVTPRP